MRKGIFWTFFMMLSMNLFACGSSTTSNDNGAQSAVLISIAVTPANPSITVSASQQFTASGNYSDNSTQNITNSVTWSSSDTSKANITTTGLATAVAEGSTTITAISGTISNTVSLTITSQTATLVSIAVTPANPGIAAGAAQQFTATGTYSDNTTQNITGSVTWSSSDTSKATISSNGLATGLDAGSTTIKATSDGISDTTTLTVIAIGTVAAWTHVSGASSISRIGTYGTKGIAASTNMPGARGFAVSWTDNSDNLWLFGGYGYDSQGTLGYLNDLWKFDRTNWTWVSGSSTISQAGVYGIKGIASATNIPGARMHAVSWTDTSGNLWLLGGFGFHSIDTLDYLNDLWKFDGTNWTWVSGSSTGNQAGVYGTKGIAASTNIPGARANAVSWTDTSGNFWLLGGYGYDSIGTVSFLNDCWKFDGTNWTWMSGSLKVSQAGSYGTKGTAAATNIPGARSNAVSWIDNDNRLWLFGGVGLDSSGMFNSLNDLWNFDGTNWTWVSGSPTVDQTGTYGTKGTAAAANIPGARYDAISWKDSGGNLWIFGGNGYASGGQGVLNDLWKFDGTNWTWMGGSSSINQAGDYGTKGIAATTNIPGAREIAVSWIDNNGSFWLFGGCGYDSMGKWGYVNDLWKYQP